MKIIYKKIINIKKQLLFNLTFFTEYFEKSYFYINIYHKVK